MQRLVGVVMNYAWGSTTHLARLRGEQFSVLPESEIWLGAHPVASAVLPESGGVGLLEAIEADPEGELGEDVTEAYGGRLPYLLKLLAADAPLSVQVHPSRAQAKAGFDAEDEAGLSLDDPARSFKDDNHKPELIVALSEFEAMVGFAARDAVLELFDLFAVDELDVVRSHIAEHGVAASLQMIVSLDPAVLREATAMLAGSADSIDGPRRDDVKLIGSVARDFPGDPGVVLAMLLNRVVLEPGEGVYLGAGVLHAYVKGLGVEVMANCDNVIRGGLTQKHINVDALVNTVDPDAREPLVLRPSGDVTEYATPAPEFSLTRLVNPKSWARTPTGPEIVLGVAGATSVSSAGERLDLRPGEAAWIRADEGDYTVSSDGEAFIAAVGDPSP